LRNSSFYNPEKFIAVAIHQSPAYGRGFFCVSGMFITL